MQVRPTPRGTRWGVSLPGPCQAVSLLSTYAGRGPRPVGRGQMLAGPARTWSPAAHGAGLRASPRRPSPPAPRCPPDCSSWLLPEGLRPGSWDCPQCQSGHRVSGCSRAEQGGGLQGPWPWEQCPQGCQYSGATGQACREGGGRLAATWGMGSCCWCLAQPPASGLRQGLGESRGPPKLGLGVLSHLRPGFPQAARPRGTRWPAQSMGSGVARLVSNLKATSLFR